MWTKKQKTPPLPKTCTDLSLRTIYLSSWLANLTSSMSVLSHAALAKVSLPLCLLLATFYWLQFWISEKTRQNWNKYCLDKSKRTYVVCLDTVNYTASIYTYHYSLRIWRKCYISANICSYQLCFRTQNPERGNQKWSVTAHTSPLLKQA